jgi:hypothetical protein
MDERTRSYLTHSQYFPTSQSPLHLEAFIRQPRQSNNRREEL